MHGVETLPNLPSRDLGIPRVSTVVARPLSSVEARFLDNWEALSRAFGMGQDPGRVHAVLFLADEPQTASEVAATAGRELARVEAALQYLLDHEAVQCQPDASGEVAYVTVRDPWAWFASTVRQRAKREFAPLLASIRDLNHVAQQAQQSGQLSASKVQRIAQFSTFVDQVAKLFETLGGASSSRPMMSAARVFSRFMCG